MGNDLEAGPGGASPRCACSAARQAFESWAREHTQMTLTPAPEGCVHPDYYSGTTQRAWEAWQEQQRRIDLAFEAAVDGLNDKLGHVEALIAVSLATKRPPTAEEHAIIMDMMPEHLKQPNTLLGDSRPDSP